MVHERDLNGVIHPSMRGNSMRVRSRAKEREGEEMETALHPVKKDT